MTKREHKYITRQRMALVSFPGPNGSLVVKNNSRTHIFLKNHPANLSAIDKGTSKRPKPTWGVYGQMTAPF